MSEREPQVRHGGMDAAELATMLNAIIEARGGLSAIHRLLDEAATMQEIRERFARWQTGRGRATVAAAEKSPTTRHTRKGAWCPPCLRP